MWKQSYFWFSQPSSILNSYDYNFLWLFVGLLIFGLIMTIASRFTNNQVHRKLIKKFANLGWTLGLSGLTWAGLRYENTPIFANRYWAALTVIALIVWLLFIIKYLVTKFGSEKREFDKTIVNSKYIPGRK